MNSNSVDLTADEDYVRPPDRVVREQLIQPGFKPGFKPLREPSEPEDPELAAIMAASLQQYEDEMYREFEMAAAMEESRRQYDEMCEAEKQVRKARFMNTRRAIERVMGFDKENKPVYQVLLDGITLYEEDEYTECCVDEPTYARIMLLLKTLRISPGEYEDLKSFVCVE